MNEAKYGSPMPPPEIVASTRNPHKLDEIRAILNGSGVRVLGLGDLPPELQDAPDVVEDRPDLEGNAAKKAETIHRFTALPTMADDTGLEVDALGGRPGVHSARYAGESATDADNRQKLLGALSDAADRSARFRTVIAYVTDDGTHLFEGVCEGTIIREERGTGGFGYDPIFLPDGHDRTFAELSTDEKNRISHRARAVRAFAAYLGVEQGAEAGRQPDETAASAEAPR